MDTKAAFDREAFEKFITDEAIKRNYQFMDNLFSKFGDGYAVTWVDMAWMGWKASRTAIEIELKQFDDFKLVHYGTTEDYANGYIEAQNNANKDITSHGIRIKWGE